MAATAEFVTDSGEVQHVSQLMLGEFPQIKKIPEPSEVTILRLTPKIISILNYEKGFGHTELVEV